MSAPAPRRRRRRPSADWSATAARWRCSTAPARATPAARADPRGDGARGHRRPPRRHRGHRRLPAGRSTWSPGSSATRATSCSSRRRRTSARWACSRPTSASVVHVADGRRRAACPRRCAQAIAASRARPARRSSSSTRSRTSTTPPASRRSPTGAPRCSRSAAAERSWSSRTTRTACSASTASRAAGAPRRRGRGRDLPRLVLQDVRARAAGRLGAGAARRAREAGAGPRRRRPCARRRSPRWPSRRTWPRTTGRGRSRRSARCTASAATPCSTSLDDLHAGRHAPGPSRPAASTSGSTLPDGPRRQGDAAARGDRAGGLRARAPASSPTASGRPVACGCRTATPSPSASARACAAWPASSRRSWSCAHTFGATRRPSTASGPTLHRRREHRP